ncbi:hypothetical protein AKO1_012395, partial [Acrasis kona]
MTASDDGVSRKKFCNLNLCVSEACLILINLKKANNILGSKLNDITIVQNDVHLVSESNPSVGVNNDASVELFKLNQLIEKLEPTMKDSSPALTPRKKVIPEIPTPQKNLRFGKIHVTGLKLTYTNKETAPSVSKESLTLSEAVNKLYILIEKVLEERRDRKSTNQDQLLRMEKELRDKEQHIIMLCKTQESLESTIKTLRNKQKQDVLLTPRSTASNTSHLSEPVNNQSTSNALLKQYVHELSTKMQEKQQELDHMEKDVTLWKSTLTQELHSLFSHIQVHIVQVPEEMIN